MPRISLVLAIVAVAACGRPDAVPLEGWFLTASSPRFRAVADPAVRHGGRASARLEADDVEGTGMLTQAIPADAYRGARIRFSGFVRTDDVTGWAGLWLRIARPGARAAFANMQERPIRGSTPWTRYEVVLDVAADATGLQFGLIQDGPGVSHLDDAALEIVGRDVALTEIDRRPRALVNGGFEAGDTRGWLLDGFGRPDVELGLDRRAPRTGAASAWLHSVVDHPRGEAVVVQNVRADDHRGKRLRASAWFRGADVAAARLYATVQIAGAGEGADGVNATRCALPAGTFAWRRCEVVLDVPPEADTIELGIALAGRGSLAIDDVALDEVAVDVPVTPARRPGALGNGDFEAGLAPWELAGGARSHYEAALDRGVVHGGHASARLASVVAAPLGYGVLVQVLDAAAYRGRRIRLTGAIRSAAARGDLWLRVQRATSPSDGPGVGWASRAIAGTADWRDFELVVDVPADGDAIQIGAGLRGPGTLGLDDVQLEAVRAEAVAAALRNADFEVGEGEPDGWLLTGGAAADFEAAIDRSQHASGAASVRLRPRVPPTGYGTLMQSVPALGLRGKRMRLTAAVRGEAVESGGLWLRVQAAYSPADGPGLGGGACPLTGSFAWTPCELVFDVPDAGDAIQIGLGLAGPGTAWLDHVTLDEVPRTTPLTTASHATPRPTNLDFEARPVAPR